MADALRNILLGDATFHKDHGMERGHDPTELEFLVFLTTQSPSAIESEAMRLAAQADLLLIKLQELSKQSHAAIASSAVCHTTLCHSLPALACRTADLQNAVSRLEQDTISFQISNSPSRLGEGSARLESRQYAILLLRNVERLVDLMELPTLLSSALSAAPPNFSSALDIYSYTRRLLSIYPSSSLVAGVAQQADQTILRMASELVFALKTPSLKLAGSIRLVGWLRRILPDLESSLLGQEQSREAVLASLFLLSRLDTLVKTLDALEPLEILARHEREIFLDGGDHTTMPSVPLTLPTPPLQAWSGCQHTERYLKRYIEIFREHSFNILSMYRGIFSSIPSVQKTAITSTCTGIDVSDIDGGLSSEGLSSPHLGLTSLPSYIYGMIFETLRFYLPVFQGQASRESIITQVLYCAGSLGRHGCDFSVLLADIGWTGNSNPTSDDRWAQLIKRHRIRSDRLQSIIGSTP